MARAVWFDSQVDKVVNPVLDRIVEDGCSEIREDVRNSFNGGSAHKQYKSRKGDGSIHYSSKPPLPPNIDTGKLFESISWATSKGKKSSQSFVGIGSPSGGLNLSVGAIGTTFKGSRALEMGSAHNNLEPRPFLTKSLMGFKLSSFLRKYKI